MSPFYVNDVILSVSEAQSDSHSLWRGRRPAKSIVGLTEETLKVYHYIQ